MWWKIAIPVLTIIVLLFKFHGGNFGSSADTGGFMPTGIKGVLSAVVGAGVVFSYLGFEQADQLAGEIKNAQQNLPRAIITAVAIGTAIYILLQIVFIAAMDPSVLTLSHGWTGLVCPATGTCNANDRRPSPPARSPAWRASSACPGWRSSSGSTRSSPRSAPA